MAFGLNFNKAKVLASAEKFVQQGKLQGAIAEYEKIIKEDPKDLTVLNTIGDLSARVGQNEQAAIYFRKAGDQYAQDGFTVKAIAIYKKLTRLMPGDLDYVSKLADLYTHQGLMSDARAQYMQVADHFLKTGDNAQGARVLQRILDLDPENTTTKSKLADLYLKLGKKDEARNIYYTAAESLYSRGAYDAAEEALDRVIKMDPNNASALMLRGMIAADSGNNSNAIQFLSQVPDLDSRVDGLRALLRAKLQTHDSEGLENLASRLLAKHNDLSGIRDVAMWYAANNQFAEALHLYEEHITELMSSDQAAFQQSLPPLIGKIKDNPEALSIMLRLLEKTDDSSHVAEIMELQAHASAHKGQFQKARDLYQKLTDLEPENSLHQQNYKQMQTKLGEDPASRSLSAEEASQAFMVEALEDAAPAVHQNYDPAVEKAIEAALTDAELFVSYNVPAKAIPPLEAVLPMAPRDVTVNQRLATLYARSGRYAEAARTCHTLSEIYRERGHEKEAAQYLEAAQSYSLRAPKSAIAELEATATVEIPAEPGTPSVQEFSFDVPDHLGDSEPADAGPARASKEAALTAADELKIEAVVDTPANADAPFLSSAGAREVDISSEWEDMLTVDAGHAAAIEIPTHSQPAEVPSAPTQNKTTAPADQAAEKIKEIQFYIDQEMWGLAKKAILDLTEIAPDAPEITELISAVSAGQSKAAAPAKPAAPPQAVAEFSIPAETKPQASSTSKSPLPARPLPQTAPDSQEFVIAPIEVSAEPSVISAKPPLAQVVEEPKRTAAPLPNKSKLQPPAAPPKPAPKMPEPHVEESPLEEILEIESTPPARRVPVSTKEEIKKPAVKEAKKEATTEDILSDFVGDLEKTELVDFAPHPKAEPVKPTKAPIAARPPAPAAVPSAPAAAAAAPAPDVHAGSNGKIRDIETNSLLTDILAELQEENVAAPEEGSDPETHYNLGIAFKEMGLLDEAIGELQKVCHAIGRGNAFSQQIQAYTWLAQCLVDKGAPEAAVRWYQQALQLSGLDDSSRCAIYYDLAAAYEASGDDKSALANFMEVYGSNIDFRDVASRIKALKS